jgi:hypothetical protein
MSLKRAASAAADAAANVAVAAADAGLVKELNMEKRQKRSNKWSNLHPYFRGLRKSLDAANLYRKIDQCLIKNNLDGEIIWVMVEYASYYCDFHNVELDGFKGPLYIPRSICTEEIIAETVTRTKYYLNDQNFDNDSECEEGTVEERNEKSEMITRKPCPHPPCSPLHCGKEMFRKLFNRGTEDLHFRTDTTIDEVRPLFDCCQHYRRQCCQHACYVDEDSTSDFCLCNDCEGYTPGCQQPNHRMVWKYVVVMPDGTEVYPVVCNRSQVAKPLLDIIGILIQYLSQIDAQNKCVLLPNGFRMIQNIFSSMEKHDMDWQKFIDDATRTKLKLISSKYPKLYNDFDSVYLKYLQKK